MTAETGQDILAIVHTLRRGSHSTLRKFFVALLARFGAMAGFAKSRWRKLVRLSPLRLKPWATATVARHAALRRIAPKPGALIRICRDRATSRKWTASFTASGTASGIAPWTGTLAQPARTIQRMAARLGGQRPRPVNLALQGGGAHGAYTWGVLDALSEADRFEIAALSGSSAGAMNAVVFAAGHQRGGGADARTTLAAFWKDVSEASRSLFQASHQPDGMFLRGIQTMARFASPYQFNPLDFNPLRAILEKHVDFDRLRTDPGLALYIAATDVETGAPRIFTRSEMTADVVLASACLPQFNRAVEIDGRHYWDGGFSANPPLMPLVDTAPARDTVIVQIMPAAEIGVPRDVQTIVSRHSRLSFAAPLRRDIEEILRLRSVARDGLAIGGRARNRALRHRFHLIRAPDLELAFGSASALNPKWDRLVRMREMGVHDTMNWIEENARAIGRRSTVALDTFFREVDNPPVRRDGSDVAEAPASGFAVPAAT